MAWILQVKRHAASCQMHEPPATNSIEVLFQYPAPNQSVATCHRTWAVVWHVFRCVGKMLLGGILRRMSDDDGGQATELLIYCPFVLQCFQVILKSKM